MTLANMYQVKRNMKGEEYANLGRFHASSLRRQMENEFQEDLGFCIRLYRNPNRPVPLLIFFRRGDIDKFIKGFDNLGKSKVVYVNLFKKKNDWVMKISPVKGGDNVDRNYINSYGDSYDDFVRDCLDDNQKPWSYEEWASYWKERDSYEQDQIDRSRLTDAERYGDDED
jgi:hypothetical protein